MLAKILTACKAVKRQAVKRRNLGAYSMSSWLRSLDLRSSGVFWPISMKGIQLSMPLGTDTLWRWLAESPDESRQRNADEKDV